MHSLLTLVVLTSPSMEKADYEYLLELDYLNTRLIIVGTTTEYFLLQSLLGEGFASLPTAHCNSEDGEVCKSFHLLIKTPYWAIATPYELLAENFLEHTTESLTTTHPAQLSLQYLVGFLSQNNAQVEYSQVAVPELSKTLKLNQLFSTALWFHPCVKILYATETTQALSLMPQIGQDWWSSYQAFSVQYFANLFTINNYTEPDIHYFPGAFLVPKIIEPTQDDFKKVYTAILEKSSVWQMNKWSKMYLASLKFSKKHHILATQQPKSEPKKRVKNIDV